MPTVTQLEQRLAQIAHSLESRGDALALLGLGSVGIELERLDEFSDLDFFAIVQPGAKAGYLASLDWLTDCAKRSAARPDFYFKNTVDGYKFLYEDGVFCEFAVFEPNELSDIPFAEGRVVWSAPGFDTALLKPKNTAGEYQRSEDIDWLLGEALTNLYVGLCRFQRGEKLSAMRFIQCFALDRVLDLLHLSQAPAHNLKDNYMPERRLEQRFPESEHLLATCCQGYLNSPASALAQLKWLEQRYSVNPTISAEIRRLADL